LPRRPQQPHQANAATEQTAQRLVDQCLEAASQLRASDIHIEPREDRVVFRMRVDGELRVWQEVPLALHPQVLSRLKILARLDISDKRHPQDGRFTIETPGGLRDFRLATAPMLTGEKAVIRVLQHDVSKLTIKSVGYSEPNLRAYYELLAKPHGLILHCGPTGSGKTTALYAAINHLSTAWRNIQTIEDPVEGRIGGVNQAQVNPDIGLTFANILRSYLRQDCDVILVGEIRDAETAELAVQASLTGHLVLGTLHTNSAVGAVSRLSEMGVPPFFIASALMGAISQRLVRRLCKACRQPFRPTPEMARQCNLGPQHQLFRATGCPQCGNQGYRGRVGIQEVLAINPDVREAIQRNASESELQRIAAAGGMTNIFMDGVAKAVAGLTTLEEIYKSVISD
jgi:type II secretory ATPase GspE/PulE/Tfp pilus assembly ATPase PilB-like protein